MFGWTYIDGNGEECGTSEQFDDQKAAEDWMGVSFQGLVDVGVVEAVLMDHDSSSSVYRMGLLA